MSAPETPAPADEGEILRQLQLRGGRVDRMRLRHLTGEQAQAVRWRRSRYSRIGKMRRHRHRLLIEPMRRGGATFDQVIMRRVCVAFDVLPEDIGIRMGEES